MNVRKRQSQSAERGNQQSSIKLQSEQKQGLVVDPAFEMEYIEDLLMLMARINRTQFQDAQQLKHSLKTQNSVYLNLLQLITSVIDPYFEIKSFSDEKFQLFLKRLGYPCKTISKTRFMSLGSSHTYLQSLHILSWLCRQAQSILSINERLDNGQYQSIEVEHESCFNKMKKLLAEYLQYGYTQQIEESTLEKCYKDAKQRLTLDSINIQKEISRLTCELNVVKTQDPNLQELEEQYKAMETELITITNEVQDSQQILEQTRQEINQSMNKQLEIDNEIIKIHKAIEIKRIQISQQPIKIDKAKEMEAKDHQLTILSQQMLNELQRQQKELDKIRQEKTDVLCKLSNCYQFLNTGKIKIGREYEQFERITPTLVESKIGISIDEDENLMDMECGDLSFEQKFMTDKFSQSGKKNFQACQYLVAKDSDAILKLILPNKDEILADLDLQLNNILQKLLNAKNSTNELKVQLHKKQKQIEEIECGKKMLLQEISYLSDSTEELKVMKEIFLEHQAKHQELLKDIEQRKMEIKFLTERKNLELIEIDQLKQSLFQVQENIHQIQLQAETLEEQNNILQMQFKEWVKENLDQFQQFIRNNSTPSI